MLVREDEGALTDPAGGAEALGLLRAAAGIGHAHEAALVLHEASKVLPRAGQEAFARALEAWPGAGIPERPGAWLTVVARRRLLDVLRRRSSQDRKHEERFRQRSAEGRLGEEDGVGEYRDERLVPMFTCSHPVLSTESRTTLMLKIVGGLSVPGLARAFMTTDTTIEQRLVRAKRKIRESGIPFRIPEAGIVPESLDGSCWSSTSSSTRVFPTTTKAWSYARNSARNR